MAKWTIRIRRKNKTPEGRPYLGEVIEGGLLRRPEFAYYAGSAESAQKECERYLATREIKDYAVDGPQ